jgi:hypothetical protein
MIWSFEATDAWRQNAGSPCHGVAAKKEVSEKHSANIANHRTNAVNVTKNFAFIHNGKLITVGALPTALRLLSRS